MFRRWLRSRARHFLILLPAGLVVGVLVGWAFNDVLFGLAVGPTLGALFAMLFALRGR